MATNTTTDKRALRYPNLVACLSGKMERDAVNYQEDLLSRLRGEVNMLATIFGFSIDSDDWTKEKIETHNWGTVNDPNGQAAMEYLLAKVEQIKLIERRRDGLWKEVMALQQDREPCERGVLVRAFVDNIGYQVSLYQNGAEIDYSLRDFGGSPTEDEQEQMEAILHRGIAHYMHALARSLRTHFDGNKPLKTFDYKSVNWD